MVIAKKKKKRSSLKFSLLIFNFRPKINCSLKKKKRSSPKFGLLFLAVPHHHLSKFPDFAQIFHIAAMVLPKYFPKYFLLNYGFAQIFCSHCPKNLNFAQIFETWGGNCPPAPPAGTAMLRTVFKRYIKLLHAAFAVNN